MLDRLSLMRDFSIHATDGSVGLVKDVYFDDHTWGIRYFVVDTGNWIPGRLVLLSPEAVLGIDVPAAELHVRLDRAQIENSPGLDSRLPLSRRQELELRTWYGWPIDWPQGAEDTRAVRGLTPSPDESSLRSADEVIGYTIHARDGDLGRAEDLLVDHDGWQIRYLVVNTRPWWPGGKVLVAPQWIEHLDWADAAVHVRLSRDEIRHSPPYDPSQPVDAEYEQRLHEHYRPPGRVSAGMAARESRESTRTP